jgi:hypothetical protein
MGGIGLGELALWLLMVSVPAVILAAIVRVAFRRTPRDS